jgi:hypothetical protein
MKAPPGIFPPHFPGVPATGRGNGRARENVRRNCPSKTTKIDRTGPVRPFVRLP